ncbi:DUF4396 domain-containing protein [Thiohalorhabdus methylotrophus]|uniref:DUF4396 domain-containing protein n=1 Tax=Thiohalorhabdus methylotrophus TaxID=3242694 RepID=A0ABV4TRA5_9GAMM
MPEWVHILAVLSVSLGVLCAVIVAIDIIMGHRQKMWIMELVWPLTALYAGPLGLWSYFRKGRLTTKANVDRAMEEGRGHPASRRPFWQTTGLGTTHCGAGCTLGDIVAEWGVVLLPFLVFHLFGYKIFSVWVYDYLLAFSFGIVFQYFTIKPMRGLSPGQGMVAAVKADALSLTSWQLGMYGWMAIVTFGIVGHELHKTTFTFWFMMQIAMLAGFLTSYPVNWWLLRQGIKEKM